MSSSSSSLSFRFLYYRTTSSTGLTHSASQCHLLTEFVTITRNLTIQGWSCARIAFKVLNSPSWKPVSASTVYQTLTLKGYSVFKRTVKLGLTVKQMAKRLKWYLDYRDEDWRHIIFSDETSVQLSVTVRITCKAVTQGRIIYLVQTSLSLSFSPCF